MVPIKLSLANRFIQPSVRFEYKEPPGTKIAIQFERDLLMFADRFRTRRVYAVQWTKDRASEGIFRVDCHYKFFTFNNRALAYDVARHYKVGVRIYDFKCIQDAELDSIKRLHGPNADMAVELWKTLNTCANCGSVSPCKTASWRGTRQRLCLACLHRWSDYFTMVHYDKFILRG